MKKTFCLFKNLFISGNRGTKGISCIVSYKLNRMLNINIYNFSAQATNFSSTNGKNKYSWVLYFPENEYYVSLPCINGKTKIKYNKSLKDYLSLIIDINNKDLSYKLEYFLYLHTNDENKELIRGVPESDSVLDNKYSNQVMGHIYALAYLENVYQYRGYYLVHTDIYDTKLVLNKDSYIKNIYDMLQKYVIYMNEEALDTDGFIAFKKYTVLKITEINKSNKKSNSSGLIKNNDTRKSNNYGLIKNDGTIKSNINTKFINNVYNSYSVVSSKRFYSTLPIHKLVVNSTYDNIIFVDNQSILFLSNMSTVKDVIIKISKDVVDKLDSKEFGKHFFIELNTIFSKLKVDYYVFNFYFYIESKSSDSLFDVFTFDPFNNNCLIELLGSFGYFKVIPLAFRLSES